MVWVLFGVKGGGERPKFDEKGRRDGRQGGGGERAHMVRCEEQGKKSHTKPCSVCTG